MSYKSPSNHEFHSAAQGLSDDVRVLADRLRAVLTERSRSFIDLSKSLQGMDESKDNPWIQKYKLEWNGGIK